MTDPLSIASGIAGLVSIAESIFSKTYRYAKAVHGAERDVEALATGIRSLSGLLHGLRLVVQVEEEATTERNFQLHHINSCQATLTRIETRLDKHKYDEMGKFEKAFQKLKWPFSSTETKELITEVERHKSTISIALSADGLTAILKALSRQNEVVEEIKDLKTQMVSRWAMETHITLEKQRGEVLKFFGIVDPTSNHTASINLRHPMTGLWVTDGQVFRNWLQTRNSRLWLSGIPGAGKTVLAASLIDETMVVSSPSRAVAYFYCDYKDVNKQDPVNIMGSMAAQLARQNETAFKILEELFQACRPANKPSFQPQLSALMKTLAKMIACFEDVSILVDGLDECGQHTSLAIESILGLASLPDQNARVLLLSRDIPEVRGSLDQDFAHLEIAAQSEDLKLYVAAEIETRQKKQGRGRLKIKSDDLKSHIRTTLVEKAAGMFRWVACQLDYLCECPTDTEKRAALNTLPPTLNGTYERILETVDRCHPNIRRMVRLTLQWIINGQPDYDDERMSIEALCEAISISDGQKSLDKEGTYDEEDIISYCSSLVRRSADGSRIELAHFTVQEFLASLATASNSSTDLSFYAQPEADVHSVLGRICLTYLTFEDFNHTMKDELPFWDEEQVIAYPFRCISLSHKLFDPSKQTYFVSWARDFIYLESIKSRGYERHKDFAAISKFMGGFSPLHIAAAMHSIELCEWLIGSGSIVKKDSALGTPFHCALIGISGLGTAISEKEWKPNTDNINWESCRRVIQLLVNAGANADTLFKDPNGTVHSCFTLAIASGWKGLNVLLTAGVVLDQTFLLAFKDYLNRLKTKKKQRYGDIDTFYKNVKKSNQTQHIKDEMLDAIVALKSTLKVEAGSDTAVITNGSGDVSRSFYRAIQLDQKHEIERILHLQGPDILSIRNGIGESPLHVAVEYESLSAVKFILSLKVDPNSVTKEGLSPLHYAVSGLGAVGECIRELLRYGADSTMLHPRTGLTCWHMAIALKNDVALQALSVSDERTDICMQIPDKDGDNSMVPLLYAAYVKNVHAVKVLLPLVSDEILHSTTGWWRDIGILNLVVRANSIELLKLLRSRGIALDQTTPRGRTALFAIPGDVDLELVQLLIESGADINSKDSYDKETALHEFIYKSTDLISSGSDFRKIVKILLPADVLTLVNMRGHSIFYSTLMLLKDDPNPRADGLKCSLQVLLDHGFNLGSRYSEHATYFQVALSFLSGRRYIKDWLMFFVKCIDDMSVLDYASDGLHPMTWALSQHCNELAQLLLTKGLNVNLLLRATHDFGEGQKPLPSIHFACFHGTDTNLFREILTKSHHSQLPDGRGFYLPHIVCTGKMNQSQAMECLQALSESELDLNKQSNCRTGVTPLMLVSATGKLDVVKFLINKGYDVAGKDRIGWTAVHHAIVRDQIDVIRYFKTLGTGWQIPITVWSGPVRRERCNVLHLASLKNSENTLEIVLEQCFVPDIDSLTAEGHSPLHLATVHGHVRNVEVLLSAGANIDLVSSEGLHPIHYAARAGNPRLVQVLLQHGCLVEGDGSGMTPEAYARIGKSVEVVEMLKKHVTENGKEITRLANVDQLQRIEAARNPYLSSQLALAISNGNLELCKILTQEGASIRRGFNGCLGCNPLLYAIHCGRNEIAICLIGAGASTSGQMCKHLTLRNGWTFEGQTAVHLVCFRDITNALLSLLLDKDAELGHQSFNSPVSPVHIAVASNNTAALRIILEHFERSNTSIDETIDSVAAFDTLAGTVPQERIMGPTKSKAWICDAQMDKQSMRQAWLLSYPWMRPGPGQPAFLTSRDVPSGSGLHVAAYTNNVTAIEILLSHGSTIDLHNDIGDTPLHIAARVGHLRSVETLLRSGARMNSRNNGAVTPALYAADGGHIKIIEMLAKWGASLHCKDASGRGMLHRTASGQLKVFSFLLGQGLDIHAQNNHGETPLEIALRHATNIPGSTAFVCNYGIDFERFPGVLASLELRSLGITQLKHILRRLPKDLEKRKMILNWNDDRYSSAIFNAISSGRTDLLQLLLDAGADLEMERKYEATPLLHACSCGLFPMVKHLVRAGASVSAMKARRPNTAVEAARDFPDIVRWLLVGRHTEQAKILAVADITTLGEQESLWSGGGIVEVRLSNVDAPIHSASSFIHAVSLSTLRRRLQGKLIPSEIILN